MESPYLILLVVVLSVVSLFAAYISCAAECDAQRCPRGASPRLIVFSTGSSCVCEPSTWYRK